MNKKIILLIVVVLVVVLGFGLKYFISNYSKNNAPEINSTKQFNNLETSKTKKKVKEEKKESKEQKNDKVFLPELFIAKDLNDKTDLESFRGNKPLVLNYWAQWCPPCKAELPGFNKIYNEYKDRVTFLFLANYNGEETIKKVEKFVKENNYDFTPYYDIYGVGYTLGLRSLPTTIFLAKDGEVVNGVVGAISEDKLEKQIKELLK